MTAAFQTPMTVASPLRMDETGTVRVGPTRVTLDTVVYSFLDGMTAEQIVDSYPSIDLGSVYAVIAYYLQNRTQVESYLGQREKRAAEVRQGLESARAPGGLRDRLLARKREIEAGRGG